MKSIQPLDNNLAANNPLTTPAPTPQTTPEEPLAPPAPIPQTPEQTPQTQQQPPATTASIYPTPTNPRTNSPQQPPPDNQNENLPPGETITEGGASLSSFRRTMCNYPLNLILWLLLGWFIWPIIFSLAVSPLSVAGVINLSSTSVFVALVVFSAALLSAAWVSSARNTINLVRSHKILQSDAIKAINASATGVLIGVGIREIPSFIRAAVDMPWEGLDALQSTQMILVMATGVIVFFLLSVAPILHFRPRLLQEVLLKSKRS